MCSVCISITERQLTKMNLGWKDTSITQFFLNSLQSTYWVNHMASSSVQHILTHDVRLFTSTYFCLLAHFHPEVKNTCFLLIYGGRVFPDLPVYICPVFLKTVHDIGL